MRSRGDRRETAIWPESATNQDQREIDTYLEIDIDREREIYIYICIYVYIEIEIEIDVDT